LQIWWELRGQHVAADIYQVRILVSKLPVEEYLQIGCRAPFCAQPRVAACDQLGIDSDRRICDRDHLSGVAELERVNDHLLEPPEQWTFVRAKRLHHRDIRSDEDEQHGLGLERAVPRDLQRAFERWAGLAHPRELVEHDYCGPVWKGRRDQLQGAGPTVRSDTLEHCGLSQRGAGGFSR
jgi:hypothetical protein